MRETPTSIRIQDGIAYIPLGGKRGAGLYTTVLEKDLKSVVNYSWHVHAHKNQTLLYAATNVRRQDDASRRTVMLLHRIICPGIEVDHADGNGLNNVGTNLRLATHVNNRRNQGLGRNNTSGFKGIWRKYRRWKAEITVNREHIRIGSFPTKEDAARAYDAAARTYFSQFARLNFPLPGERDLNGKIVQ